MDALLDSYQFIVGIYILYVAIKGKGQMYRFGNVKVQDKEKVSRILRMIYFVTAGLCFLDGAISGLQRSLFRVRYTEDGMKLIEKVSELSWWKTVSYENLDFLVTGIILCIFVLLVSTLVIVRKHSIRNSTE